MNMPSPGCFNGLIFVNLDNEPSEDVFLLSSVFRWLDLISDISF